jgi:hypothetical protein
VAAVVGSVVAGSVAVTEAEKGKQDRVAVTEEPAEVEETAEVEEVMAAEKVEHPSQRKAAKCRACIWAPNRTP